MIKLRLVLADSTVLKDSITVISEIVNEARFKVTKEGLELIAMDPANVAMVIFKLLATNFAEYEVENEKDISLNLSNLKQILKRTKANETLILEHGEENKLKLQFKSSSVRTFHLPLLEIEDKEQRVPNLSFPVTIQMPSYVLTDAVEDSSIVAESVAFTAEPDKLIIDAEGDLTKVNVEIKPDDSIKIVSSTKAKVRSKYSIEYLKKMMQGSKLSNNVNVYLSQDYPLKLEYKVVDKLSLSFILAPRMEND